MNITGPLLTILVLRVGSQKYSQDLGGHDARGSTTYMGQCVFREERDIWFDFGDTLDDDDCPPKATVFNDIQLFNAEMRAIQLMYTKSTAPALVYNGDA